jgi:hypothetical protein
MPQGTYIKEYSGRRAKNFARCCLVRHAIGRFERATDYPGNAWSNNIVIRSTRDFWVFHAVFWLLAGIALFLYGLTYGHAQIALVRNLYSPLVGFACSYLIRAVFENAYPATFVRRLLLIAGLSLAAALVSALVVNPITFGLLGYTLGDLPLHALLKDGLYFVLLYIVWSLLYLQFTDKPLGAPPASATVAASSMDSINVTKGSKVFKLDPANITCIKASGDYVELVTGAESYLKQGPISFYEQALSQGPFVRIHRSIIVNSDKIAAISGPAKGQYWIRMQDGQELRSSRRYREVVESLLPEAP